MKKKAYKIFITLFFPLVDFCIIAFAIVFSYKLYLFLGIGKQVYYEESYMIPLSLLTSLSTALILFLFGVYKKESSLLNVEELKNVTKGLSFSFFMFMALLVFAKIGLSRYVILFSFVISMVLIITVKTIFYHLLPLMKGIKGFHKRILIYGAGELGQALYRAIANSPKLDIVSVGCIDDDPDKINKPCRPSSYNNTLSNILVLGTGRDAERIIKEYNVDEVVVAISNISREDFIKILNELDGKQAKVSFVPNLYEMFVYNVSISQIGDIPIVRKADGIHTMYPYIKRCMDIFLSVISLIILSPVFLIVPLLIKRGSEGPVFFKQKRVGVNGKEFYIYKFRSMTVESDPYAVNPLDTNDARVTKVGRFLRKTSLDEMPQIINVLKREMSFVGPRPEMPFIVDTYEEIHRERLKRFYRVLPGYGS